MHYSRFGRSGLATSVLTIGAWRNFGDRLTGAESRTLVREALDHGITTFDTADVYPGAEEAMGEAFAGIPRRRLVVATKCFWPASADVNDRGLSRKHLRESVDTSLARLRMDYVDLFMCHRFDASTPLLETLRTFDDLIRAGKILYWGTSQWDLEQIDEALALCRAHGFTPPVVEQSEYSLAHRRRVESGYAEGLVARGIGLMCWSPLASGMLAGRNIETIEQGSLLSRVSAGMQDKYASTDLRARAERLRALARARDVAPATVALAWLLRRPGVSSVAVGVSSPDQLAANAAAVSFEPDAELLEALERLFPPTGSLN